MEGRNTDHLFKKILENYPPELPDLDTLEDMYRRLNQVKKNRNDSKPDHDNRQNADSFFILFWKGGSESGSH